MKVNVSGKSGISGDIKTAVNEIKEAESLVKKAIGDLVDVPLDIVTEVVSVSRSTLQSDVKNQFLKELIESVGLQFSPQSEYIKCRKKNAIPKKRERFHLWSRDAVIIYRAFKRLVKTKNPAPAQYDFFAAQWLPLIVKTYAQRRNQTTA